MRSTLGIACGLARPLKAWIARTRVAAYSPSDWRYRVLAPSSDVVSKTAGAWESRWPADLAESLLLPAGQQRSDQSLCGYARQPE